MYWAVQKNLVKGCRQTLDCYCVSCELLSASIADALWFVNMICSPLRVLAHRHFVFLQNFVKSSLGRIFAKDLRFCEQLLRKIKVNTIAEEGRTWKKGSKSSPLLCSFLRQIQFLNFKIWTSQEACCLSYHFFKYKPNFTKFCTDTKPVSANSHMPDTRKHSTL